MHKDLIWLPATTLRKLIGEGEVSPIDLVEACLAQIEALDAELRAFVHVDREGALEAARQAAANASRGDPLGPLHGIPVALKDDLWVAGMPATTGSLIFSRFVPSHDGTVARRLREAGAILIGKTNVPEFVSWPRTRSLVGGETRNPWDPNRIPGASSGGSAAAVASGMVPLAIGTDGGGSVRIPAALCGIVGLLPSIGRVPDYGAFLCSPISSAGPMARNVRDVALLEQVIAGPDPDVPAAFQQPADDVLAALEDGVAGLRFGWSPDFGRYEVQPGVEAACRAALAALRNAGAEVGQLTDRLPHPWGEGEMMAEVYAAAARFDEPESGSSGEIPQTAFAEAAIRATTATLEGFFAASEVVELLTRHADLLSPPQRLIAEYMRRDAPTPTNEELRASLDAVFAQHDYLCSPTMAWVAPHIPDGWASPYPDAYSGTNFTFIANANGCPAISVPCGLSDGMPVGFQIIGRPCDEAGVLRVARALEVAASGLWPRPVKCPA